MITITRKIPKESPTKIREKLRLMLQTPGVKLFPGAISPLTALQIEEMDFDGVYISGSVLSNDLGYPDVGLTTLSEVRERASRIARVTNLPCIVDADTGFGEVLNLARTTEEFIEVGLAGCHFEDQSFPKKCGHLEGKSLVPVEEMVKKIKIASRVRDERDPNFVVIARTDARAVEGFEGALRRAQAYVSAGADVIFPEALESLEEFRSLAQNLGTPCLANMTEFGKGQLWTREELEQAGVKIIIYPVTLLRVALYATKEVLQSIKIHGHQKEMLPKMFTRKELYELTRYTEYARWDEEMYRFELPKNKEET